MFRLLSVACPFVALGCDELGRMHVLLELLLFVFGFEWLDDTLLVLASRTLLQLAGLWFSRLLGKSLVGGAEAALVGLPFTFRGELSSGLESVSWNSRELHYKQLFSKISETKYTFWSMLTNPGDSFNFKILHIIDTDVINTLYCVYIQSYFCLCQCLHYDFICSHRIHKLRSTQNQ